MKQWEKRMNKYQPIAFKWRLQIKYRNNRLESDHGKLKRLTHPARGFQSMKTAYATIKGFEVMRMFKKGQFKAWMYGNRTEVSFINKQFGLYS